MPELPTLVFMAEVTFFDSPAAGTPAEAMAAAAIFSMKFT